MESFVQVTDEKPEEGLLWASLEAGDHKGRSGDKGRSAETTWLLAGWGDRLGAD